MSHPWQGCSIDGKRYPEDASRKIKYLNKFLFRISHWELSGSWQSPLSTHWGGKGDDAPIGLPTVHSQLNVLLCSLNATLRHSQKWR